MLSVQKVADHGSRGRTAGVIRHGEVSVSTIVLVSVAVVLMGVAIWIYGSGQSQRGEPDIQIAVICADCGHTDTANFSEVAGRTDALGHCAKCGKLAMYRSRDCQKCGKPVAPTYAVVDGQQVKVKCFACGTEQTR